jgi:ELWxxDGT repeat protein
MKKVFILFLSLSVFSTYAQQTISDWKHNKDKSSNPQNFVKAGKKIYFVATTPEHGRELWVTEGTTESTKMVKDIMVGENSGFENIDYNYSNTYYYSFLSNTAPLEDGSLYFVASDNPNEKPKVWVTDGTEQGTKIYQNDVKGSLFYNDEELVQYNFERKKDELTIYHKDQTKDVVLKLQSGYTEYTIPAISQRIKSKNLLTLSFSLGSDVSGPSYYVTLDLKSQKIVAQTTNQTYYGSYFEQGVLWNNDVYLIMRPQRYSNFQSVFRLNSATGKCDTVLTLPIKTSEPSLSLLPTTNQLLLKSFNNLYSLQNDRFIPKSDPKSYKDAFGSNPFYDSQNDIMYTFADSSYIVSKVVNQQVEPTLFTNIKVKGVKLSDGSLVKDVALPTQVNVGFSGFYIQYPLTPTKLMISTYGKDGSGHKILDISQNQTKEFPYQISRRDYDRSNILQNNKVIFSGYPSQKALDDELYSLDIATDEVKLLKNINTTGVLSSKVFTTNFEGKSVLVYNNENGIMLGISDGTRSGTKDIQLLTKNGNINEIKYVDFKEKNGRLGFLISKKTQTNNDSAFLFSMDKKFENIKLLFSAIGQPSYTSDKLKMNDVQDGSNFVYLNTYGYDNYSSYITDFTVEGTLIFNGKVYNSGFVAMSTDKYLLVYAKRYDYISRENYLLRYDLKNFKVDTLSKEEYSFGFLKLDDKNYAYSFKSNKWFATDGLTFTELQGVKTLSRSLKINNKTYFVEDHDEGYASPNGNSNNHSHSYSIFQLENNVSKRLFTTQVIVTDYQKVTEKIWEINGKTFLILSIPSAYGSDKNILQIYEIGADLSFKKVRQIDDDKSTIIDGTFLDKGMVYSETVKDENIFYVMKEDLVPVEIYRTSKNTKSVTRILETNKRVILLFSTVSLLVTDGTKNGSKLLINNNLSVDDVERYVLFSEHSNSDRTKGEIYFSFEMPYSYGINLWKTDGTEAGTIQLFKKSPIPRPADNFEAIRFIGKLNNQAFFNIKNNTNDQNEIWTTEGTLASTKLLKDVNGDILSQPTIREYYYNSRSWLKFDKINNKLYFSRQTLKDGYEPWETDGTPEGTKQMGDLVKGIQGSNPYQFIEINQLPYCIATEENKSLQLWSFCNPKVSINVEKIAPIYTEEVKLISTQNNDWKYQWLRDGKALDKANAITYTANVSGTYQMKVEDKIGCTNVSDSIVIKFAQKVLANEELTDEFDLKIYPNPTQNDLNLIFDGKNNSEFQLSFYDISGKLLINQAVQSNKINTISTQNLSAGAYFIRLTNGEKQTIRKIMKE